MTMRTGNDDGDDDDDSDDNDNNDNNDDNDDYSYNLDDDNKVEYIRYGTAGKVVALGST